MTTKQMIIINSGNDDDDDNYNDSQHVADMYRTSSILLRQEILPMHGPGAAEQSVDKHLINLAAHTLS